MDALTLTAIVRPGKTAALPGYGTVTIGEPDESGNQLVTVVLRQKGARRLRSGRAGRFDNHKGFGDTTPS